ncbi:DedA family protein [Microtetraspora malaysiensis]|uniref:DedA family protein n=1 Tax=Microtetraspora malaysiensis TaxID=161358 RepID=UPI00082BF3C9|nr:DedA family protein [Microtetraspora malaysiensis]
MRPPLPGPLADLAPLLHQYGYAAVAGLILLEDFGVPAPGETILVAAAVYAGAGHLNIYFVVLVALAAAIVGDNIGYVIGRVGGRRLIHRWGRYVLITPERFHATERFFLRHGAKIVVIARFIEGLRQVNGLVAGTTGMPWRRFLVCNAIGAVLWVGVWAGAAYFAGKRIGAIYNMIGRYQNYAWIALGLVVAAVAAWHLVRHLRRRKA